MAGAISLDSSIPINTQTATNTAAKAGGALSKGLYVFNGMWADEVGKDYIRKLKSSGIENTFANRTKNLINFDWKKAIGDSYRNHETLFKIGNVFSNKQDIIKTILKNTKPEESVRAIKKALAPDVLKELGYSSFKSMPKATRQAVARTISEQAAKASKTGIFSSIGKLLGKIPFAKTIGKNFWPIFIIASALPTIWTGFKEGGIGEGLKEIGRTIAHQGAFVGASLIAGAVLGLTGFPLLLAGIGGSMALSWGVDKIFGKSLSDKKAEQQEQLAQQTMEQTQQQYPSSPYYKPSSKNVATMTDKEFQKFIDDFRKSNSRDLTLPTLNLCA